MPQSHPFSEDLSEPPEIMLAFDPGLTTGWARFDKGLICGWGALKGLDELRKFLLSLDYSPDQIVYEDFKLFKHRALQQSGSKMEASQAIGAIGFYAASKAIPVESQPAGILPVAQKWSKMKMPSNHKHSHHISAVNHGVYWLVSNNMMLPVGMEK